MMELLCLFFLVPLVIVGFLMLLQYTARSQAKEDYLASLEKLKRDPQNPDLREQTLTLGRKYAKHGVYGFDELALMNDISAACARAASKVASAEEKKPSVEERLTKLDELRSRQMVSELEYQSRRQQILNEL
jgi:hypothetical protein